MWGGRCANRFSGIRPSQRRRRVGDYELKELLGEGPDHAFQDWHAEHVSLKNDTRRIRIYVISRQPPVDPRVVHKMAESEYDILSSLRHDHILEAQTFTEHELGPAVLFRHQPGEIRLDHYLKQNGASLPLHLRIEFVRQIADALRYAHGRRVIHRALGPQSILVTGADPKQPQLKTFNWQAGRIVGTTSHSNSVTLHAEDWLEEGTYVYIAPEAIGNRNLRDEVCDIFSLGALAFLIFANQPPAPNLRELHEILSHHQGLPLPAVLDGAGPELAKLIRNATHPDTFVRTDSAAAFLKQLDAVEEEITAPDDTAVADPLKAAIDDRLPGNLIVKRKLGAGGSAAALLVERNGEFVVLKIALKPEYNSRLRDELQVLRKLRHPFIAAPKVEEILTFNGLNAFLVELAGERTLADRLREDGRLSGEFLERFGDDLLNVLEYLEHEGIPHRDLKPVNIGVREYSKQLHLKLFDFSLSSLPIDNIRAGTPDYMEPFLSLRHRWDTSAEIFFSLQNGGGQVAIDNLTIYQGGAGPWRRDFENGFVLVNPFSQPHTFSATDLAGSFNRTGILRINGTQAPEINNGGTVTGALTLGPSDAIILLADPICAHLPNSNATDTSPGLTGPICRVAPPFRPPPRP